MHFSSLETKILIQLIGVAAMALGVGSFQVNRRRHILLAQSLSAVLWMVHFFLLGAYTGAAMNLVSALRNFIYGHLRQRRLIVPLTAALVFCLAAALTWQGARSWLPLIGSIGGVIALWQVDTGRLRLLLIPGGVCWIVYDVLSKSYPGAINDSLTLVSIVVAIWRFDLHRSRRARRKHQLKYV